MHLRKHPHEEDAPSAAAATTTTATVTSKKKERRRKQSVEIPLFLICVFGLLVVGLVVTITLFLQTPSIHDTQHQLLPGSSKQLNDAMPTGGWVNKVATTTSTKQPNYHTVFSTSCSDQMHWESYVLFYHAFRVKQPGNVTRLLSGCSPKDEEAQMEFYKKYIQTLSPNFHVHLTPDFSLIDHHEHNNRKEFYKYMNKPFALRHWLENVLGYKKSDDEKVSMNPKYDDDVVFLIDPDMILLQPLTHDFSAPKYETIIWVQPDKELQAPDAKVVRRGHPFSQQDGYLGNNWLNLDLTAVTLDAKSPVHAIKASDGPKHWNSGPPYILTAHDAYRVADLWTAFAPRVHKQFPKLFAEMFGYIIATAHLELPHTFIKSLVVSTTQTPNREGWALVDAIPTGHACPYPETGSEDVTMLQGGLFGLHYCKRYMLGRKAFWSKYRLRKDIFQCKAPLLEVPDPAIQSLRESMSPPPIKLIQAKGNWSQEVHSRVTARTAKREAFMLCGLISKTNEALEYFKRQACPEGTGNYSKVYNVHTDTG
jgi:hypothetical protein